MIYIPFITAVAMLVPGAGHSAPGSITLRVADQPLDNAFRQLMAQSECNFIYEPSVLAGRRITVDISDATVEEALRQLFDGTGITWTINGRNIMLHSSVIYGNNRSNPRRVIINGFVRESSSGEALIGALVSDPRLRISAVTNSSGYYAIELPEGTRTSLSVSYPGMERVTTDEMTVVGPARIDFDLNGSLVLDEVSVIADAPGGSGVSSASVGHINLSSASISNTPVIFGESDVIKTLQLQPGVSAGMEGLSGMYVHGGDNDQNLVMLDNVPLYHVSHLGGLFSAINTQVIKNVDFYKSSFPARYNGRLSSVVEINTKDGSLTSHHGSATLGLISGSFNIDGPIVRGRTSYSVAIRRTWIDLITAPAVAMVNHYSDDLLVFGYNFTDLNAKVNHRFNDRSRMYVSLYWGNDRLKSGYKEDYGSLSEDMMYNTYEQTAHMNWGNLVASAGYTWQAADRLYTNVTGSFTRYSSSLKSEINEMLGQTSLESDRRSSAIDKNNIGDWSMRAEAEWIPSQAHHVVAGAGYVYHRFTPRDKVTKQIYNGSIVSASDVRDVVSASEVCAYIGDDWHITSRLRADYGANFGLFSIGGHTHTEIDPRVSLRWLVTDNLSVKGAYAGMSQYVHQLTTSVLSLPTDQWVPIDGSFSPERVDNMSFGVSVRLPWLGLNFNAEAYWKRMEHILDLRDDYYLVPQSAPWYERLCEGKGRARGFDFMLERRTGAVTGQLSYSLLWADRQFADRNGGRRYPARYDNRHKINILVNWHINDRWKINAAWTGMSGNRITLSTQDYAILDAPDMPAVGDPVWDGQLDLPGTRNGYRLPFYHRLDLSAVRYTRRGFWTFSLFNAYCNMNTIVVRKDRLLLVDANGVAEFPSYKRFKLLPVIPSVSYTWNF